MAQQTNLKEEAKGIGSLGTKGNQSQDDNSTKSSGSQSTSQTASPRREVSKCETLQNRLKKNRETLSKYEEKLDGFFSSTGSDLVEMNNLTGVISYLKSEISQQESEQVKLGCISDQASFSYDHQTILSTSSVRRKDAKALERTPESPCDNTGQSKK